MKLLTISNLYPRPDQPQRGIFNAQLFEAIAGLLRIQNSEFRIQNVCLVPEWRVWKWPEIRGWGKQYAVNSEQKSEIRNQKSELSIRTVYLPVFYLPVLGRSISWWTYLRSMSGLKDLVSESDVVFSTWLYPDGVAAILLADFCGRRSWIMVQGSDTFHLENASRCRIILEACSKVQGVVCVCKGLADRLIDAGVESAKVHVVPNGVNGELFRYRSKEDAVKQLSVISYQLSAGSKRLAVNRSWLSNNEEQIANNQYRIVLFVGNLVPVKAPDILLEAWSLLINKMPITECQLSNKEYRSQKSEVRMNPDLNVPIASVHQQPDTLILLFIGDGPMRKQLENKAREFGIADSVFFLGSRPHEEIALWMNVADCLCLPSRSEGMPNVVIEALVSGLPVVAADVGGVSELLEEEPAARIVESRKRKAISNTSLVTDIAAAINDILKVECDRKAMAERSKGRFSWNKQAGIILDLINKGME